MFNKIILENFNKLIKLIEISIDNITDKNEIKINKYRLLNLKKSLLIISKLNFNIIDITQISNIKGIGKGTLKRVDEILKTNKLKEVSKYNKIIKQYEKYEPIINELMNVIGIGRVMARKLVFKYKIKSINDLKKKIKNKEIYINKKIKLGLKYIGKFQGMIPRKEIDIIYNYLQDLTYKFNNNSFITICGSYRRGLKISSDIDVLLANLDILYLDDIYNSNLLNEYIQYLTKNKFLVDNLTDKKIITKYMGFCKYESYPIRRIDIRFIPIISYGTALLYFTGSYEFNQMIRNYAKKKGFKLNEYELFNLNTNKTEFILYEQDVFDKLNLQYLSPNER